MERKDLVDLIINCLEEVLYEMNDSESESTIESAQLTASTTLLGKESMLDSLALVTLIISTEQALKERHGISITIVDERALSMKKSPFRTIETLADYVWILIEERRSHAA